jgi:hypothetical protein
MTNRPTLIGSRFQTVDSFSTRATSNLRSIRHDDEREHERIAASGDIQSQSSLLTTVDVFVADAYYTCFVIG